MQRLLYGGALSRWWYPAWARNLDLGGLYFLMGLTYGFPMTAMVLFLNNHLKWAERPWEVDLYYSTVFLLFSLKFLCAGFSDVLPVLGLRRKPYIIFGSLLTAAFYVLLGLAVHSKWTLYITGLALGMGESLVAAALDGLTTDRVKEYCSGAAAAAADPKRQTSYSSLSNASPLLVSTSSTTSPNEELEQKAPTDGHNNPSRSSTSKDLCLSPRRQHQPLSAKNTQSPSSSAPCKPQVCGQSSEELRAASMAAQSIVRFASQLSAPVAAAIAALAFKVLPRGSDDGRLMLVVTAAWPASVAAFAFFFVREHRVASMTSNAHDQSSPSRPVWIAAMIAYIRNMQLNMKRLLTASAAPVIYIIIRSLIPDTLNAEESWLASNLKTFPPWLISAVATLQPLANQAAIVVYYFVFRHATHRQALTWTSVFSAANGVIKIALVTKTYRLARISDNIFFVIERCISSFDSKLAFMPVVVLVTSIAVSNDAEGSDKEKMPLTEVSEELLRGGEDGEYSRRHNVDDEDDDGTGVVGGDSSTSRQVDDAQNAKSTARKLADRTGISNDRDDNERIKFISDRAWRQAQRHSVSAELKTDSPFPEATDPEAAWGHSTREVPTELEGGNLEVIVDLSNDEDEDKENARHFLSNLEETILRENAPIQSRSLQCASSSKSSRSNVGVGSLCNRNGQNQRREGGALTFATLFSISNLGNVIAGYTAAGMKTLLGVSPSDDWKGLPQAIGICCILRLLPLLALPFFRRNL